MIRTPAPRKPKERVKAEERRLRRLEFSQKGKALFDRERQMRQLREARSAAEQLENFLAQKEAEGRYMTSLNPAHRQAADAAARQLRRDQLARQMVQEGFTGRAAPGELMRFYPPRTAGCARR